MEHMIAELVQNFEQGKINRRELIQGLALAVTVASGRGAAPAVAATGPGFKAVSIHHLAYEVPDYAKVRDFYADVFGMAVLDDTGTRCHLRVGDTYLEPGNSSAKNTPRIEHLAIGIENYTHDGVEAELKRRGIPMELDGGGDIEVKDPAGFRVQIFPKYHLPPPARKSERR